MTWSKNGCDFGWCFGMPNICVNNSFSSARYGILSKCGSNDNSGRDPHKQLPVNFNSPSVCTFSTRNLTDGPSGTFENHTYKSCLWRPSNKIDLLQCFMPQISLATSSDLARSIFDSARWCGISLRKSRIKCRSRWLMPRAANTSTRCLLIHSFCNVTNRSFVSFAENL